MTANDKPNVWFRNSVRAAMAIRTLAGRLPFFNDGEIVVVPGADAEAIHEALNAYPPAAAAPREGEMSPDAEAWVVAYAWANEARTDVPFDDLAELQQRVLAVINAHPHPARPGAEDAEPVGAAYHLGFALNLLGFANDIIDGLPAAHDEIGSDEWVWRHQYAVFLDPASAHPSFAEHGKPEDCAKASAAGDDRVRAALSELRDAVAFLDKFEGASLDERIAVGTDAADRLYAAARAVDAALAAAGSRDGGER